MISYRFLWNWFRIYWKYRSGGFQWCWSWSRQILHKYRSIDQKSINKLSNSSLVVRLSISAWVITYCHYFHQMLHFSTTRLLHDILAQSWQSCVNFFTFKWLSRPSFCKKSSQNERIGAPQCLTMFSFKIPCCWSLARFYQYGMTFLRHKANSNNTF